MKPAVFFSLQLKRLFKNKSFLLLLLLFPVFILFLSHTFRAEEDTRIRVGLCLATEDSLAETLCKKLTETEDSLFTFFEVSDEDELKKLVQSNQIECGYLFRKPLGAELNKSRIKNLITVYISENTTCKGILNELVYASLFEEYALSLLKDCLYEASHLPFTDEAAVSFLLPPVTDIDIERSYRSHLSDGSTFRFEIHFLSEEGSSGSFGTTTAALSVIRGLTAVFLLICGFLGLLTIHRDRKNGLYTKLYGVHGYLFSFFSLLSYLLPSAFISLLIPFLSGCAQDLWREVSALLCYIAAMILFYLILGTLISNHTMLCAAFPMILLCTLVFTPVIADLSVFFPWIKAVRYALPAYYYLMFF